MSPLISEKLWYSRFTTPFSLMMMCGRCTSSGASLSVEIIPTISRDGSFVKKAQRSSNSKLILLIFPPCNSVAPGIEEEIHDEHCSRSDYHHLAPGWLTKAFSSGGEEKGGYGKLARKSEQSLAKPAFTHVSP